MGSYLAAYWIRFTPEQLTAFLSGIRHTLPIVVVSQLTAIALVGAYRQHRRITWLVRVVVGIFGGAAAASLLVYLALGYEGVSRSAFVAEAMLLSIGAIGWRAVWVLRTRAQGRVVVLPAGAEGLVDRTLQLNTVGSIVRSLYGYRELLKNLVWKDLKLKYRGSVFGFLWSLANPLLMTIVYTLAFTYIMRVRTEEFVFYLMLALVSWNLFANSAAMSTGAIVDNAGLLKSVVFPRAILPTSTVLFNVAQYLLTIAVFLPAMMLWYHVPLALPMVLFPVFIALQMLFTIGIALLLATATAFFRDVRHLLEVTLSLLFWTTPIVYEFRDVPERLRMLLLLSPVSPFIVGYESMFFYRAWPDETVWMMALLYAVGAFVLGALVFVSFEDQFTEQL